MKKDRICYIDNRPLIYEGREKILFDGSEPNTHILHFKDTSFLPSVQPDPFTIKGKGVLNNTFSSYIFERLNDMGVQTHFIMKQNRREQLVHSLEMLPFYVHVRNAASGSMVKRLGVEEGAFFVAPIVEHYTKIDTESEGEMLNKDHIEALGFASAGELAEIADIALRVNDFLVGFCASIGVLLFDVKLEFGRRYNYLLDDTEVTISDEISPETCHFVDFNTRQKYGRHAITTVEEAHLESYQELVDRCPHSLGKRAAENVEENATIINLSAQKKAGTS